MAIIEALSLKLTRVKLSCQVDYKCIEKSLIVYTGKVKHLAVVNFKIPYNSHYSCYLQNFIIFSSFGFVGS